MKFKHYFLIIIIVSVGYCSAVAIKKINFKKSPYGSFKTFAQVFSIIKARYVQDVDEKRLMEGAYRGAVESVFDQNSYIPETLMEKLNDRREKEGSLGFQVMKRSGYALVIYSDEESDVYKKGLQAGTVLRSINGQNTYDMSLFEIKTMLKGEVGSKVKLTFYSIEAGEEVEQEFIYKAFVEKVHYKDKLLSTKVFAIHEFDNNVIDSFKEYAKEEKNYVVDLRYNQGKNYDEMLKFTAFLVGHKVSANYMEKGETIALESDSNEYFNKNLIILTSGFTMNAGAIMAEIVKGSQGIKIIGTKTSGKAFESSVFKLKSGGYVEIASGFYTPLTKKGLKPDIRSFIDDDEIESAINNYLNKMVDNGKKEKAA